ncbi:MAG: ABC transporter substrate-binding protein [Hyphomicrobiales bacterium]
MAFLARRLPVSLRNLALGIIALAASFGSTPAHSLDFGKPGEPVHLVVGHPCCYTEVWSVMVLRGKELWKKYLPEGSTVEYQTGLQGSTIVNSMLAGKQHIGYIGDLPAIIASTKTQVADVRLLAVAGVAYDQCNVLLARTDAPEFKSPEEAAKWLSGKQMAVPKGACSDMFSREVFKRAGVEPSAYLNQNVEVITSGFRAGKLDSAAIWEPVASRLVLEGLARRITSGVDYGLKDSGYVIMRGELVEQRPDVVKGWLKAELEAQRYMTDPKNAKEIIDLVKTQTTGFPEKSLWMALYNKFPKSQGGTDPRMELPFVFTPEVMGLLGKGAAFLHEIKAIPEPRLRDKAVMPAFAEEVLKEAGLATAGTVPALPDSAYTGQ